MSSLIQLELYTQTQEDLKYEGRLLGLITSEEFAKLIDDKTTANKLYTKETTPLADLMGLKDADIKDMRLVMTVKSKNEKSVPLKTLYVSDRIGLMSYESIGGKTGDGEDEIVVNTENDECLFVKEVDNAAK